MNKVFFDYPVWYLLICLGVGIGLASLLYFKNRRITDWGNLIKVSLFILRFLSGSIVAFLLLSPYLKTRNQETVKPTIVLAVDNSHSMTFDMDSLKQKVFTDHVDILTSDLKDEYNVEEVVFGEHVRNDDPISFTDLESDLSEVLEYTYNQIPSSELGGIVLITDGIFNKGFDPTYSADKLLSPIITVGLGDTTIHKDLIVKKVFSNDIAFLESKFPIRSELHAKNLRGNNARVRLTHIIKGKEITIEEKSVKIEQSDQYINVYFEVEANNPGVNHYRIRANKLDKEISGANNKKDLYIDVIDRSQKILIYTEAPHPDIGAIKKSLLTQKNYVVDIGYVSQSTPNWQAYDLVIFYQLPSKYSSIEKDLITINRLGKSRIFIAGSKTLISSLNKHQDIVTVTNSIPNFNQTIPQLNSKFNDFILDQSWINKLVNYPPLQSPFGEYLLSKSATRFLDQKIGSVITDYPLIAFNNTANYKETLIAGEGIWKWRLHDYLEHNDQDGFDNLLNKIIQYTILKIDRRRFMSEVSQTSYNQNERISFKAELYNKSFEAINESDAFLKIKDQDGKEFEFVYDKLNQSYSVDVGTLPVGLYTATSNCNDSGKKLVSVNKFSVQPIQLEAYSSTANHELLRQLSHKTKGAFFKLTEMDKLSTFILNHEQIKPIIFERNTTIPLLHLKALLVLLIILLGLEWFIRRYSGSY